ncbi:camphor resistance protein CrcB [Bacillus sp. OV322]|uniref:fluoride efflux transporter FluC n=1 Tax=Bacillus sp. OV322 TaxID=1882764 RepID=UPI0008E450AD|nr:CrcB family protein [Bacillus sp. OV322]SFC81743.1 camphor resistance protein CrcB [Bacillus sp. OV322]
MVYLYVGFGGILGAILRYVIGGWIFEETVFPFATLSINLAGSFLLAWLTASLFKKTSIPSELKTAIGTGFVGSFTTFSTLSIETVTLFKNGHGYMGGLYIAISIIGGVLMSRLGFMASGEEQKS